MKPSAAAKPGVVAVLALALFILVARVSRSDTGAPAEAIPLSQVLSQLSQNEQVREKLLQSLDSLPNAWGLLGDKQRARLRDLILNRNWQAVDRFPGITVSELRASVTVANFAAGKLSVFASKLDPPYVETGSFAAGTAAVVDWQPPPHHPSPPKPPIKDLGYQLTMGDGPHPELWQWHAQSQHAAYLFNRLALNRLLDPQKLFRVRLAGQTVDSPEALLGLLQRSGYDLWIEDARYFANFGHLHFKNQDVRMPFWLDTRIPVPHANRSLLVPVSHAEYEIHMRGQLGNADVSFYYGIDGMAEFRTTDTLDQYWVGKNVAHAYRQTQAVEVTRLLAEALRTYSALHRRYPDVPFSGYYRFGVCQDVVAAVEYKMHGRVTLFPITHEPGYFKGTSEIDRLFGKIPNDRNNRKIEWSRVRGSLPSATLADIRIPDLSRDLELVDRAQREHHTVLDWTAIAVTAAMLLLLVGGLFRRYRF